MRRGAASNSVGCDSVADPYSADFFHPELPRLKQTFVVAVLPTERLLKQSSTQRTDGSYPQKLPYHQTVNQKAEVLSSYVQARKNSAQHLKELTFKELAMYGDPLQHDEKPPLKSL